MTDEGLDFGARYLIRRRLGEGGMGVVYHAHDRERGAEVALKTLQRLGPAAIYRLKNEFRALADLSHPSLVALHELVAVGDRWFFTMELVLGVDFMAHVRGAPADESPTDATPTLSDGSSWEAPGRTREGAVSGAIHEWRLRSALLQLGEGVAAIHEAGKLHRDLKPGNVLVTDEGRVVVLDFGLVGDIGAAEDRLATSGMVFGTPEHMAPEQALGERAGPACDWYAVGVMLFEALTGRLPFEGEPRSLLEAKTRLAAPDPRELAEGLPEDLAALASDLLAREPSARPTGDGVLERLRGAGARPRPRRRGGTPALFGRSAQLATVALALDAVGPGRAARLDVHGASGMGKTALLGEVVRASRQRGALVLAGRCYERESVPFKAFDAVVDALARHVAELGPGEVDALLPGGLLALSRLFPVLGRVAVEAELDPEGLEGRADQEVRRLAFEALEELLGRLSARRPVVVVVDDLQWGDVDSVALARHLLARPGPPGLLLVLAYRDEERGRSPALAALLGSPLEALAGAAHFDAEVGPLSEEEAARLALSLLGRRDLHAEGQALAIAREAEGCPFFVGELVRSLPEGARRGVPRVAELVSSRVAGLRAEARVLLETVAVAARSVPQSLAVEASGLGPEAGALALGELRAAALVRTSGARYGDGIEAYHDRIREAVADGLEPAARRGRHEALAAALARRGGEPEELAYHLEGAGRGAEAARFALAAADAAASSLAFDRAARLYGLARHLGAGEGRGAGEIEERRGRALANAGRSAEAAEAFAEAARHDLGPGRLELRRRAAEHLLRAGQVDRGVAALEEVLAEVGLRLPATEGRALASLMLRRLQLMVHGYAPSRRRGPPPSAEALARLDACWTAASGLGLIDLARGAHYQTLHALLALDSGDPFRALRALAFEAPVRAAMSRHGGRLAASLLEAARARADELGTPYARGLAALSTGFTALQEGRWRRARSHLDEAELTFREGCHGATWELDMARISASWALAYLGKLGELGRRVTARRAEVGDQGDLFEWTNLVIGMPNLVWLLRDEPGAAVAVADEALSRWTRRSFTMQHLFHGVARAHARLYEGDAELALAEADGLLAKARAAGLTWNQLVRAMVREIRARALLAAACRAPAPEPLTAQALVEARRLEREGRPWTGALASLIRGQAALLRGERTQAQALLRDAIADLEAADMALHAAAARHLHGKLEGGFRGEATAAEQLEWLAREGAARPSRFMALVAPLAAR